jgi:hypothetical protein
MSRLPSYFPDFLSANLRRTSPQHFNRNIGFSRATADRLVPEIIRKLTINPDGTLSLSGSHTADEVALVETLCGYIAVREAFTARRLFDDFEATLRSQGLLTKPESRQFQTARNAVTLFAVSVMHNSVVILGDGTRTRLLASPDTGLSVNAHILVTTAKYNPGYISSSMFLAELEPPLFCEALLLAEQQPWLFDVELLPNGKIGKLG